jgi:hypothetical protein
MDVDELAPGVHQAVQVHHHPFGVALGACWPPRIGHPQHRWQRGIAQHEQSIEALAGVLAAGEEQTAKWARFNF